MTEIKGFNRYKAITAITAYWFAMLLNWMGVKKPHKS